MVATICPEAKDRLSEEFVAAALVYEGSTMIIIDAAEHAMGMVSEASPLMGFPP